MSRSHRSSHPVSAPKISQPFVSEMIPHQNAASCLFMWGLLRVERTPHLSAESRSDLPATLMITMSSQADKLHTHCSPWQAEANICRLRERKGRRRLLESLKVARPLPKALSLLLTGWKWQERGNDQARTTAKRK